MWMPKAKWLQFMTLAVMSMPTVACAYDTLTVLQDIEVGSYWSVGPNEWTGRAQQGIAAYEGKFYTSAGASGVDEMLFKHDPTWVEARIEAREVDYDTDWPPLTHLGDIDVYNGYVYGPLTDSLIGGVGDLQRIDIAWFDAESLEYEDHIDMSWIIPGYEDLDDISGLAFKDDQIYILGYEDDEISEASYSPIFVREMNGNVPGDFVQTYPMGFLHANGLAFKSDYMFISWGETGNDTIAYINIYRLPLTDFATPVKTYQYATKAWHAEGITFNGDELWVAQNEYVLQLENPLPEAPTGVSASKGTYTDKVRAIWNTVSDADAYGIYRNTSNNPTTATNIGSNDGGMNNVFDDYDTVGGRVYYYWIRASKDVGGIENLVSEFSASDCGWVPGDIALTPSDDAMLLSGSPDATGGNLTSIWIWIGEDRSVGAIKFGLSSIPIGSVVDSAELRLYCDRDDGGTVEIAEFYNGDWSEDTITWNNHPPTRTIIDDEDLGSIGWWTWNSATFPILKSKVQEWVDDPEGNYGLALLTPLDSISSIRFNSKESPNSNERPRLIVNYTPPTPPTILGYVRTSGGSGISGVAMTDWPGTDPVTTSSGYYSGIVSYGWSGTITPSKSGYTFSPTSKSYSNVRSDKSNENYTGTLITPTISGYVTTSGGAGISGVTMTGWPGTDPVTSSSGYYSGTVYYGWSGRVTPSKSGYSFNPPFTPYSNVTSDKSNENYTGTQAEITIDPVSFEYNSVFPGGVGEDTFELWNSGGGTPEFTIGVETLNAPLFVSCDITHGTLYSDRQTITFTYDATLLCQGTNNNWIRIDVPEASNSPQYVQLRILVYRVGYPVANDDSVTVNENSTGNLIDVLANDSEPHGLPLTVTEITPVAHGTVELIEGQVFYTPEADYLGSDSFTYMVDDIRCGTDSATVNITVAATPVEIWVDDDYDTTTEGWGHDHFAKIQDALDIASNGVTEEITVYPGTYYENIDFKGKQVKLRSTDPNDPNVVANTIIDGNNMGTVISFISGENELSVLSGFTIRNGQATEYGGGIEVLGFLASPVIRKNVVVNNAAGWSGGGMYAFLAKPVLRDNVFSNNSAEHWGGAIYLRQSELTSSGDVFVHNYAHSGGGVYLVLVYPDNESVGASASLTNSLFVNNYAEAYGGGVAAWDGASVLLSSCVFACNEASAFGGGGGIHVDGSTADVVSCTFCANRTNDFFGAAVDAWAGSSVSIVNTVIAHSTRGYGVYGENDSEISVMYSNVFGNPAGNYSGLQDPTGENGCMSADPLFVNLGCWDPNGTPTGANHDFWIDGDYRLRPGSPCIDAADGNVAPVTDILGNTRHDDPGTHNTGAGSPDYVDMGAYEFQGTTPNPITGDFCGPDFGRPDRYVDVWDLMQFADHWHTRTGQGNWDGEFDLVGPDFGDPDGYVDVWDLMVFADHWHEGEKP
ncbi:MAG: hypothetical protein AMJ75_00090 [Phycisphaerae bacterium SM1_79]|nr:MAG: hypothetical protein AMJ75_00090 [Phycisphaerae bacterium SM1_79]